MIQSHSLKYRKPGGGRTFDSKKNYSCCIARSTQIYFASSLRHSIHLSARHQSLFRLLLCSFRETIWIQRHYHSPQTWCRQMGLSNDGGLSWISDLSLIPWVVWSHNECAFWRIAKSTPCFEDSDGTRIVVFIPREEMAVAAGNDYIKFFSTRLTRTDSNFYKICEFPLQLSSEGSEQAATASIVRFFSSASIVWSL